MGLKLPPTTAEPEFGMLLIDTAAGAAAIVNDWSTEAAASYVEFPAWSAWTVQVPAPSMPIVAPLFPLESHTPEELTTEKLTVRPEDAEAETVTGTSPYT
jgi:hypothetical protein